jgi:hypothetical protein
VGPNWTSFSALRWARFGRGLPDKGGQTAAVLCSFTATCKHLGIDAFAYLRDVLERLPTHPLDRLEELLPHQWQAARSARKASSFASKDADSKDS